MRNDRLIFALLIIACLSAGIVPLFTGRPLPAVATVQFPGWPAEFEGRQLQPLPLTAREQAFQKSFPGRLGRFTDGQREIVIRWVWQRTRRLHAAADCFRGVGYRITPKPLQCGDNGQSQSVFKAQLNDEFLLVREYIADDTGAQFADVSSWYWAAWRGRSRGPWWAFTVVERTTRNVSGHSGI